MSFCFLQFSRAFYKNKRLFYNNTSFSALQKTNAVYAAGVAEINRELLMEWLQDSEEAVPPAVLDCVVTVPVGEDGPGIMRQEGPAQGHS